MFLSSIALLACMLVVIHAAIHELIIGTFSTKFLYTVEFDDETFSLQLVGNTTVPYAANWLAFSPDKANLYTTAYGQSNEPQNPMFVSYALTNATAIEHKATLPAGGDCKATSIFIVADPNPPHDVYGTFFASVAGINAGCGSVFSVDDNGVLDQVIQNYTYFTNVSGVHGTAFSPDSRFLYSADDTGNTLWTHSINRTTREVTYLANLTSPSAGANPRHVTVHPKGKYLYVILEEASQLAQYTIDKRTGLPSYDVVYPLIFSTQSAASYWADEVALSFSNKYLWATNRARAANSTGYISAFSLDEDGAILKQNFLIPTTSSGGLANILTASPFSDRFVALTSNSTGFIEVWELSEDGNSASVAAHLDINDGGGCCANALWYS
ncbi:hypothetical protein BX600DRAFT_486219 [Xylariales sp. PMI_506]|nr:hypothetical protein BX600DRAFT_486219 [Xylariales sp. PMI_506]